MTKHTNKRVYNPSYLYDILVVKIVKENYPDSLELENLTDAQIFHIYMNMRGIPTKQFDKELRTRVRAEILLAKKEKEQCKPLTPSEPLT